MLTVIIAEQHIIEQFERNKALLAPFNNKDVVFCKWNREAGSVEEMLPDLKKTISMNANWRAVIVSDDNKEKINPFDYVQYSDYINKDSCIDFDNIFLDNCKRMYKCYDLCKSNPLTRLSVALCETPCFAELINADIDAVTESKEALLQYIFKTLLDAVNTKRLVADIKKFKLEQLKSLVSEKQMQSFLDAVANKDYDAAFKFISADKLLPFLEFAKIGNCTTGDPGYWFALLENTKKSQLFDELKRQFKLNCASPREVMCLALRSFDMQIHNRKVVWNDKSESMYSDFVRYNLYNENIRFLLYDAPFEDFDDRPSEILKFHILLQVLALHGNNAFSITKNKVFLVDIEYDKKEVNRTIAKLIARLKATALQINEEIYSLESKKVPELDNKTARLIFESDVKIPVQTDREYDSKNLMAEHKIGLARNCPTEELPYWSGQYYDIRKLFKRFLREPRRAVKKACTVDFKNNNTISDIRAIGLNENQRDDILIKLEEEEQSMVSTVTSAIYDTTRFNEDIEEADKQIKRGIKQRMTRRKALVCGAIAILAYFFGFLPLIFSNLNTVKSFLFSFMVTGIVIALFAICGFVYLFVLKKRQVERYKHFNTVMSGICSEIKSSLDSFSKYLSHACMVMRERSVLNRAASKETDDAADVRMLKYNLTLVEKEIEKNYLLLNDFSDDSVDTLLSAWENDSILPFDYDYTKRGDFDYSFYENVSSKEIEYMLNGHMVEVPMLCVNKITLNREELYD